MAPIACIEEGRWVDSGNLGSRHRAGGGVEKLSREELGTVEAGGEGFWS